MTVRLLRHAPAGSAAPPFGGLLQGLSVVL
jgi:hypothetical protein